MHLARFLLLLEVSKFAVALADCLRSFSFFKKIFIYLAVLDLSCGMRALSCGMWDLVP